MEREGSLLEFRQLALEGVLEVLPNKHGDARGFFFRNLEQEHVCGRRD